MDKISRKLGEIYSEVAGYIQVTGLELVGPPFAIYHVFDEKTGGMVIEAGFPVGKKGKSKGRIKATELNKG